MMRAWSIVLVGAVVACGPGHRPGGGGDDSGDDGAAPDASGGGTTGGGNVGQTFVYAHSASTLYRVDPDTLQVAMVGPFQWPGIPDQMTDLAIDKTGRMVGISFGRVYLVDPATAATTVLSSSLGGGDFNGLSFVPAEMLGKTGDDVLIGTRNTDGLVFQIDPQTGAANQVGDMGNQFASSGDLVAIAGFGTVQTTLGAPWDVLSKLAPVTFKATAAPASTGFGQIWGVAFWKGLVFGFTKDGQFVTINPTTGAATLVASSGPEWWGAAVTTTAPVIQ